MLSIATNYACDYGCPEPALRRIAEAGFDCVHWGHHWCHDFIYEKCEIEQIAAWLHALGLAVPDLHASAGGNEKCWTSARAYEREAGVNLVRNRLEMAARLGATAVVMHATPDRNDEERFWERLFGSLDELEPVARALGVRIAIENGDYAVIDRILERYAPDYVGVCYDSGHANLRPGGLEWLARNRERLLVVHLHDNDGSTDRHDLPFTGTVEWRRVAETLAAASYAGPLTLEATLRESGFPNEEEFLREAYRRARELSRMVRECGRPGETTAQEDGI